MATRRPKVPGPLPRPRSLRPPAGGKPTAATSSGPISVAHGTAAHRRRKLPVPITVRRHPVPRLPAAPPPAQRRDPPGPPRPGGHSRHAKAGQSGEPAGAAEDVDPVPAKAFSGRMLALALVMIAITILLAPSVKIFSKSAPKSRSWRPTSRPSRRSKRTSSDRSRAGRTRTTSSSRPATALTWLCPAKPATGFSAAIFLPERPAPVPRQEQPQTPPICRGWIPSGTPSNGRQQTRSGARRRLPQAGNPNRAGRCRASGREPSGHPPTGNPVEAAPDTAAEASRRPSARDLDVLSRQLGRPVRDVVEIPARCMCGNPLVAATSPRLSNGTPSHHLLPDPSGHHLRRVSAGSRRADERDERPARVRRRTGSRLPRRARSLPAVPRRDRGPVRHRAVPEIDGVSAGGMPTRVKCLHVLVGHSLAAGPGVNPLGDEAIAGISQWWTRERCYCDGAWDTGGEAPRGT